MLGLAGALALSRGLGGAPFFVQSQDPLPYVVAALTLALAAPPPRCCRRSKPCARIR
jgi:hypothetical protein